MFNIEYPIHRNARHACPAENDAQFVAPSFRRMRFSHIGFPPKHTHTNL